MARRHPTATSLVTGYTVELADGEEEREVEESGARDSDNMKQITTSETNPKSGPVVDSKNIISQVPELQLILNDIRAEGMVLRESFQVATLIEELPPTWKEFKNYLKHKHKEMKLEDLIERLRIEEDNRMSKKKDGNYNLKAKAKFC
ncbi:hypothetical protein RJ639_039331 [Escallonia herrerae]|uniref:Uncharacterized protein n=1 Tax=Escallonia herrerae TaxID=1293975 RepID=A0AA88WIW9_9ASTE|nr:hypothetical protein RJ639_039331 [Escallonia herrerae]